MKRNIQKPFELLEQTNNNEQLDTGTTFSLVLRIGRAFSWAQPVANCSATCPLFKFTQGSRFAWLTDIRCNLRICIAHVCNREEVSLALPGMTALLCLNQNCRASLALRDSASLFRWPGSFPPFPYSTTIKS